jgi:hypothetical protein
MIVCYRRICKPIEGSELLDIIPYFGVIRMEDMSTILVYVDAFDLFRVYVSCNVRSLVNYKNRFVMEASFMSKDRSVKACADN